jgi:drug/metabolite transporter (DMT)-like permease
VLIGLLIALVAMILNSTGALLQADGARRATRSRPVAVQPRYLGGIAVDLVAWLCAVVALRTLPVFAVQAVIGGSIAVTTLVGSRINDTQLSRRTKIAVVACVLGLAIVAASAGGGRPAVASTLVNVVLLVSVLVLAVAVLILRQYHTAWPLALVAGLGFGGTALAVRAAHVEIHSGFSPVALLGQWSIYLVVGFWAIGMVGYSAALGRGEVGAVTAVFSVTEVVVPGLVGILLLGDPIRAGWEWPFAMGLVVAVAGVVVLARTPAEPRRRRVR